MVVWSHSSNDDFDLDKKMKKIAILTSFLFLTLSPNLSYAEALYFQCDKGMGDWKYEKGFFGGKVYYEKNDTEWILNKETIIEEDKIIIQGWHYKNKNKSCKPQCNYDLIISLLPIKVRQMTFVNFKQKYTNDCQRDDGKKCYEISAGTMRRKGECKLQKPLKP